MRLSLALRLFLLLLGGVLLAAAITFFIAQQERTQVVEHFRGREVTQRLSDVIRLLAEHPRAQRLAAARALGGREWLVAESLAVPAPAQPAPMLLAGLRERLGDTVNVLGAWRLRADDAPGPPAMIVEVRYPDGQPMMLRYQAHRRPPPPIEQGGRLPVSLLVFIGLIAGIAWGAVHLALKPLHRMARAAEALGRDIDRPPLDVSGPREVRQAAEALNVMQQRIRHHLADRTQILSAVTHDLKTPLTRMRLRLESCDDDGLRQRLSADIAAMQALIEEGLDLARSLEHVEPMQETDLGALLSSLCDDAADAGLDARYEGPESLPLPARPRALRRALGNLIDNALKYGGDARVSLARVADGVRVSVRDHGPGIPEAHLADVRKPFYRLETSRSRETGGTGLGLAIADNLIAGMGGALALENAPDGGLIARVHLPGPAAPAMPL